MQNSAQQQLLSELTHLCATHNSISLSRFMQHVLSHPEFGYYTQNKAIGSEGDFITAPEISPLFGEIIGAFITYIWQLSGSPDKDNAMYFEAGPGTGSLLCDILRVFSQHNCALKDSPLTLLETSPKMQAQIRAKLTNEPVASQASDQLDFISSLESLPAQPLFGVANEFFDALGVDQAIFTETGWCRHEVFCTSSGEFYLAAASPLSEVQLNQLDVPKTAEIGTIIEFSELAEKLAGQLSAHIAHYGGVLLLADYGKTDNLGDTIQAVKAHKPHPFFSDIGTADLTHLVDFSALKRIADAQGARFIGPVCQADFLKELGLFERAESLRRADDPHHNRLLVAAVDRLTNSAQMGQIFKIAAILPAGEGLPAGFSALANAMPDSS